MYDISNTIISELEKFNEKIKARLDENIQGRKMTNSGNAKRSLQIVRDNNSFQSIGIFYLEFLDKGRGSGKFPNLEAIEKWVRTKLNITDNREAKQVTFLVGRKIAKLGTEIFKDNSKGLQLDKLIIELRTDLNDRITDFTKFAITKKLDRFKNKHIGQ